MLDPSVYLHHRFLHQVRSRALDRRVNCLSLRLSSKSYHVIIQFLPAAYIVCGRVMFSAVWVCSQGGCLQVIDHTGLPSPTTWILRTPPSLPYHVGTWDTTRPVQTCSLADPTLRAVGYRLKGLLVTSKPDAPISFDF